MAKRGRKFAIAAVALTGLALAGGGAAAATGPQSSTPPQRTPPPPQQKPTTPQGSEQDEDIGRTWGTFAINRNAALRHELLVLRVASSASNPSVGTGEVIADVFQTIEAPQNADWGPGAACGARRFRLIFDRGRLVGTPQVVTAPPQPSCASIRPIDRVYLREIRFVQRGPDVFLTLDTNSGVNLRNDRGQGDAWPLYPGSDTRWDNDFVGNGSVIVDVSWIFNPA